MLQKALGWRELSSVLWALATLRMQPQVVAAAVPTSGQQHSTAGDNSIVSQLLRCMATVGWRQAAADPQVG
jgi:hypothetical protein